MEHEEEYILGVVVDICSRKVLCISSEGDEKIVDCETPQEFINVCNFIKAVLEPEDIKYAEVLVAGA